MSSSKRTWSSAIVVLAGCAMVWMGSNRRDQIDLGGQTVAAPNLSGLRADASQGLDIPISEYFSMLVDKLRAEYVEDVTDRQKLASGAVRGMVTSLGDAKSLFLEEDEFKAYRLAQKGKFEGIGAWVEMELAKPLDTTVIDVPEKKANVAEQAQIPKLVVRAVIPDSPAGRAGVLVGDVVYEVDDHWIPNADELQAFRNLARAVTAKKAPEAELLKARKELQPKLEKNMTPMRAWDKLMVGDTGTVNVVWKRGPETRETPLTKGSFSLPSIKEDGEILRVQLNSTSVGDLGSKLAGKSSATLDLRNNPGLDSTALMPALKTLLPDGEYGSFSSKAGKPEALVVKGGRKEPLQLTVLVDASTRGVASQLAAILQTHGKAKIEGKLELDPAKIQAVELPDGSGYTLVVGQLNLKGGKK